MLRVARPVMVFVAPWLAASGLYFLFVFPLPSFLLAFSNSSAASIIKAVAEEFSSNARC